MKVRQVLIENCGRLCLNLALALLLSPRRQHFGKEWWAALQQKLI